MAKNLLIVTYYFPPMGGVGVQRVLKLIKYLPRYGYNPVILTVAGATHNVMDSSLSELSYLKGVPIYRIGGERLMSYLNSRQKKGGVGLMGNLFAIKQLRFMDIYSAWWRDLLPEAQDICEKENIDIIYSTSPPHSVHIFAKKIKEMTGLKWVMELRDSMTEWPLRKPGLITSIQSFVESCYEPRLYESADGIIFVTKYQRKHAVQRCPQLVEKQTEVVLNGYDEDEMRCSESQKVTDVFRIVYTGSLQDFDISVFCDALVCFSESKANKNVDIELCIVGDINSEAQAHLDRIGITINVVLTGVVSHSEALDYQQKAHCLLLIQTTNYKQRGSEILTGKVFEYIGAKRPILAVIKKGELRNLIIDNDIGIVSDPFDIEGICKAIEWCYRVSIGREVEPSYRVSHDKKFTRLYQAEKTAKFMDIVGGGG
ncbi:MAG: hypothetical protein COB22_07755 [Cycloclasticus sp.]|nr:MAG: hypothetical protein COB22_07755 [Cycloclasticus sp.]